MTDSPAFASGPVPTIRSFVTSFVGGGPEGGLTVGSIESGPLAGVLTEAVAAAVELVGVVEVEVASAVVGAVLFADADRARGAAGAAAGDQGRRAERGEGEAGAGEGAWGDALEVGHGRAA